MPDDLNTLLEIARRALAPSAVALRTIRPSRVSEKTERDLVSDTDLAIERRIRAELREATPHLGFLGEEEGQDGDENSSWVLDPIDGTVNFVRGLPLYGIALALVHCGEPVLGVVALPALGHTYWAATGHGAWCDGHRISPAPTTRLTDAVVAVGDYRFGADSHADNVPAHVLHRLLADRVLRVRMLGTAAADLVFVADGTLDASITLGNNHWDMAAGAVIAREAGAAVTDHRGRAYTSASATTIAAASGLAADLHSLLGEIQLESIHTQPESTKEKPC